MTPRILLIGASILLLAACAPESGSAKWCEARKAQPKSEWSLDDAATFARHCLLDSSTVGSRAWCDRMKRRPKGDWTADEAASYARHCVI